jgi:hypothetical protein
LQELVELAGGDEQIAAAEAGHQFLPHPVTIPHRAHDLQVFVATALMGHALDPDEHARVMRCSPSSVNPESTNYYHLPLYFARQLAGP